MDLEKDAEGGMDKEENERIDSAGDRGNERTFVIVSESYKTEDDVSGARDEGGRSEERDDVGMGRGEEEWTAE